MGCMNYGTEYDAHSNWDDAMRGDKEKRENRANKPITPRPQAHAIRCLSHACQTGYHRRSRPLTAVNACITCMHVYNMSPLALLMDQYHILLYRVVYSYMHAHVAVSSALVPAVHKINTYHTYIRRVDTPYVLYSCVWEPPRKKKLLSRIWPGKSVERS